MPGREVRPEERPTEHAQTSLPARPSVPPPCCPTLSAAGQQLFSANEKTNAGWLVALAVGLSTRHFSRGRQVTK